MPAEHDEIYKVPKSTASVTVYAVNDHSYGSYNDDIPKPPLQQSSDRKGDFHEEFDADEIRHQRRERVYLGFFASITSFVCVCLVLFSSRSQESKMARRSLSLFSRTRWGKIGAGAQNIHEGISYYQIGGTRIGRSLDEDGYNDQEEQDDDDFENANDDVVEYYQEPVYIEDDFFRYIDDDGVDDHKKTLPLDGSDIIGFLCTSMALILAVGGGIGPGATVVAVYIIVMDFPAKHAVPLSCITGLGVSAASTFINAPKRHPLTDRPVIDWDLILIMEPLTLLGAIGGTYLNKLLQEKILVTMLVLLLSIISHHTLKKARKMHHAEEAFINKIRRGKVKKENMRNALYHTASLSFPSYNHGGKGDTLNDLPRADTCTFLDLDYRPLPNIQQSAVPTHIVAHRKTRSGEMIEKNAVSVRSSLIEEEANPLPQNKITYIVTMFLFVIATNAFKGGESFESPLGITCGSLSFWIIDLITAAWLVGCTYLAGRYLLRINAIKEAVGFDYVRGDIIWDVRTIMIYPCACIIAGVVSGMFGIGSAIVTAPIMIGIGVNPSVAAATSGCMNFFTSLMAVSSYVVLGSLVPDYGVACLVLGVSATYFGRFVMSQASKRRRGRRLDRHSYIAYSMGIVVLLSALLMTAEALWSIYNHSYNDADIQGICYEVCMDGMNWIC